MEATRDHIQAATERIVETFDPLQVILFGSQARGEAHPQSDVDFLVILPEVRNKRDTALAIRRAIKDLPGAKDIVVATPEEIGRRGLLVGSVLRPALREGKVVYVNKAERDAQTGRWLRYAVEDLRAAEGAARRQDFRPRHACFQAQQAAEKALKAALVFLQIEFPYTHDLDALRDLLPEDWRVKEQQPDLERLTEGAVGARYPDDLPDAAAEDPQQLVEQARSVVSSVRADLEERGVALDT